MNKFTEATSSWNGVSSRRNSLLVINISTIPQMYKPFQQPTKSQQMLEFHELWTMMDRTTLSLHIFTKHVVLMYSLTDNGANENFL